MPTATVKSFAKQSGKTVEEVEDIWEDAKKQARKSLGKSSGEDFWRYVTTVTKHKCGIKDDDKKDKK